MNKLLLILCATLIFVGFESFASDEDGVCERRCRHARDYTKCFMACLDEQQIMANSQGSIIDFIIEMQKQGTRFAKPAEITCEDCPPSCVPGTNWCWCPKGC
mgnify:CR=1 FL=1